MERLVVRYNGNGFLHIRSLGVTFKRGDSFELVSKTGLSVEQLENNSELSVYIGNSLIIEQVERKPIVEKTIIKENDNSELNAKIDLLISHLTPEALSGLVKDALKDQVVIREKIKESQEETSSKEDEEIRKNLLKYLVFGKGDKGKANLQGYGKSEEKIKNDEAEGLDDLIDF